MEPNITAWRRAVAGDLTSTLDFESPNEASVPLPSTDAYQPSASDIAAGTRFPDYVPPVPTNQALPQQESGMRPARALPYELQVDGEAGTPGVTLFFRNTGNAAAVFHVRSGDGQSSPWTYTVGAGDETSDSFEAAGPSYDLSVYGPNGFLRRFAGSFASDSAQLSVKASYVGKSGGIALIVQNQGQNRESVSIFDAYSGKAYKRTLHPHGSETLVTHLEESFGWYDFVVTVESDASFQRQVAGHVETGKASMSDPAIPGGLAAAAKVG